VQVHRVSLGRQGASGCSLAKRLSKLSRVTRSFALFLPPKSLSRLSLLVAQKNLSEYERSARRGWSTR